MFKFLFPLLEAPGGGSGGGADDTDELSRDLAELDAPDEEVETPEPKERKVKDKGFSAPKEEDEESDEEPEDDEEEVDDDRVPELKGKGRGEGDEEEEEDEEEESETEEVDRDEAGRPTVRAIKAKYPDLFKDFPDLKRSFFVLPKYEEMFADPQQAVEAVEKSREFDDLEADIIGNGKADLLVKTLSENNPKALKRLLSSFADSVRENFEDGYLDLANPILQELCYTAFQHGNKTGNKNLATSARHIANFIWNNGGDIPDITKKAKSEPSAAERELARERSENERDRFMSAVQSIMPSVEENLKSVLLNGLKSLTTFERKAVLKDARREIDEALKNDKAFQKSLDHLWGRAKSEKYSDASKERIKQAWLSRARQIAPSIRNRLAKEALDARRSAERTTNNEEQKKRTFPGQGGRDVRVPRSRVLDPKKIDWSKTSDMDILNSK